MLFFSVLFFFQKLALALCIMHCIAFRLFVCLSVCLFGNDGNDGMIFRSSKFCSRSSFLVSQWEKRIDRWNNGTTNDFCSPCHPFPSDFNCNGGVGRHAGTHAQRAYIYVLELPYSQRSRKSVFLSPPLPPSFSSRVISATMILPAISLSLSKAACKGRKLANELRTMQPAR